MNFLDILIDHLSNHVNYMAVLVAALANFAFGALWYSPIMVAKKWAELVFKGQNFEEATKGANMAVIFGTALILGVVQALGLSFILANNAPSFLYGALAGLAVALLFVVMNTWKNALFERRSFTYVIINGTHDIIVFILMGGIIGVWK